MSLKRIYTRKEKPNCPKIPQRPMVPVTTLNITSLDLHIRIWRGCSVHDLISVHSSLFITGNQIHSMHILYNEHLI